MPENKALITSPFGVLKLQRLRFLRESGSAVQAAFRSNSARAALMPRRKAILRVTQCAVRCSGVPIAVLNCCSIRAVVAMNCSGSIFSRSRIFRYCVSRSAR